jgi:hypothetical protein
MPYRDCDYCGGTLLVESITLVDGDAYCPSCYKDAYPDEPEICSSCNGSGEGMYDGTRCADCGGEGVERGRD